MNKTRILFIFLSLSLTSCNQREEVPKDPPEDWKALKVDYKISDLSLSGKFSAQGTPIGVVDLPEASGLVESQVNDNALWAHNDSGNKKILYLLDKSSGAIKAGYLLKGMKNKDWESIEIGPGPKKGTSYIYLGDIGDNNGVRDSVTIYRFEEPKFEVSHSGKIVDHRADFDALNYIYPDGPRDSEAFLLDHNTLDLYIITKRDLPAKVYFYSYPQSSSSISTLELIGTLPFIFPVGGNVARDGGEILIKTYDQIFYWKHKFDDPLWKTLVKKPELAPYDPVEPQGEAICFDSHGWYYTLSEKVGDALPILYYYGRLEGQ